MSYSTSQRKTAFETAKNTTPRTHKVMQERASPKSGTPCASINSISNAATGPVQSSWASVASGKFKPKPTKDQELLAKPDQPSFDINPAELPSWSEIFNVERMEAELDILRAEPDGVVRSVWIEFEVTGTIAWVWQKVKDEGWDVARAGKCKGGKSCRFVRPEGEAGMGRKVGLNGRVTI